MMVALSRPSGGVIEADRGEVQSKGPTEAGPGCSRWTNEKHMTYLSSLEESFVNQMHGSPFHLHLMNMLGRSGTNQRQSDSSITTETLSDSSQSRTLHREDPKFVKAKFGVQKGNTSFPLSENQWVKHFEPNFRGKGLNIRENYQGVDQQFSSSGKSVKREHCCCSKESTSQDQLSFSSQNGDEYGEVSDQNFISEDITGEESSKTYKKKRSNYRILPPFIDQVVIGKQQLDPIIEKG